MCRLVDMDLLTDMLANMFKSDARTFHRRLGVLRCFRPDNPTGTCPTAIESQASLISSSQHVAQPLRSELMLQTDHYLVMLRPN